MIRPITAYKDNLAKAQELLELVDLWGEKESPVAALGHGQQRQVEIILAIASKPRLLLLDEPSAGLTSGETGSLIHMIRNLMGDTTVFFCAHDLDLVFSLAERVIVLVLRANLWLKEHRRDPDSTRRSGKFIWGPSRKQKMLELVRCSYLLR